MPTEARARGRVVSDGDLEPRVEAGDTVAARPTLGEHTGFAPLAQAVLECAPGRSLPRDAGEAEEVLFVLEGEGVLHLDGATHRLAPESGAYVAPGERYALESTGSGPLRLVAVRIPDPAGVDVATGERAVVRRLADQRAEAATTDREFRVVADPSSGLRSATHFVGYVPTARAPDHFHTYDEVIYIVEGSGSMEMEGERTPLGPGSCIQLPARTVHCLANEGSDTMRVVAVFRPAGSPAEAYYPDGRRANAPAEQSA